MKKYVYFALVILLSMVLASCDDNGEDSENNEMSDIYTAAALTVTAVAESNPATNTPQPSASATQTKETTATSSPTGTVTAAAAADKVVYCDDAVFVADVTVPSGKTFSAGEGFTKTWRVRNIGSCTWSQSYALVFKSGNIMGGEAVYMPYGIVPNDTIDLSVWMQAPAENGTYTGYWKIQNAAGFTFGQTLKVSIVVADPTVTYTPTVTATDDGSSTSTPTVTIASTATQVPTAVDTNTPVPVVVDTDTPVPTEVPTEVESGSGDGGDGTEDTTSPDDEPTDD